MYQKQRMKLGELGELYRLISKYEEIYTEELIPETRIVLNRVKEKYESRAGKINGPSYPIVMGNEIV